MDENCVGRLTGVSKYIRRYALVRPGAESRIV
jgi:hypothetical protein